MLTKAQKSELNLSLPSGHSFGNAPGDLIAAKVGVLVGRYDFSKMGGAVGSISLVQELDNLGVKATLPANAVIKQVTIDVITAMTSTGGTGTIALTAQSAGDLLAAVDADTLSGLVAGIPVGTAATSIKLTAARTISVAIATAALLTGKFNVLIEYYISE